MALGGIASASELATLVASVDRRHDLGLRLRDRRRLVAADLVGGERLVVDADLVDRALELLGPELVAPEAQRLARRRHGAAVGHAADLATVGVQPGACCRPTWSR